MTERKTYHATATKDGRWWAIEIHDLPEHLVGVTQSAVDQGWEEAEAMTREVIALLLRVSEESFDVELKEKEEGESVTEDQAPRLQNGQHRLEAVAREAEEPSPPPACLEITPEMARDMLAKNQEEGDR